MDRTKNEVAAAAMLNLADSVVGAGPLAPSLVRSLEISAGNNTCVYRLASDEPGMVSFGNRCTSPRQISISWDGPERVKYRVNYWQERNIWRRSPTHYVHGETAVEKGIGRDVTANVKLETYDGTIFIRNKHNTLVYAVYVRHDPGGIVDYPIILHPNQAYPIGMAGYDTMGIDYAEEEQT